MLDELLSLIRGTGFLAWPLLALAALGLGAAPAMGVVGARYRLPITAWVLIPIACVGLGALAALLGARAMLAALGAVAPEHLGLIAAAGLSECLGGFTLGLGSAAVVMSWSALWAALASLLGHGPRGRWRFGLGQPAGLMGVLGAPALLVLAFATGHAGGVLPVCVTLLAMGAATALCGLRSSPDSEQRAARLGLAVCVLGPFGVAAALGAGLASARADELAAMIDPDPAIGLTLVVESAARELDVLMVGGGALLVALLMAVFSAVPRLRSQGERLSADLMVSGAVGMLGVAALAVALLAMKPAVLLTPEARYEQLRQRVGPLPSLPAGEHAALEGWEGTLIAPSGDEWLILGALGWEVMHPGEPPAGPLVAAVPATLPATELLDMHLASPAVEGEAPTLRLLALPADRPEVPAFLSGRIAAASLRGLPLAVLAPGELSDAAQPWGLARLEGGWTPLIVGGTGLSGEGASLRVTPGPEAAGQVTEAMRAAEARALLLVPASSWTAQDVVSLCLAGLEAAAPEEEPVPCLLSAEVPVLSGGEGEGAAAGASVQTGGEIIIIGALKREQIAPVVRARFPALAACVTWKGFSAGGAATIKFLISGDGSVSKAELRRSDISAPGAPTCLTRQFEEMRFPPVPGGGVVIVSYPLAFAPTEP